MVLVFDFFDQIDDAALVYLSKLLPNILHICR